MAPSRRPLPKIDAALEASSKRGAALVLVYPHRDGPSLALTLRSTRLRHHGGQVSFPGGRADEGETTEMAALRECHEEIGVEPAAIEIIGSLSPLWIPPSNFIVYPVVGASALRPTFRPDGAEVARVIELSMADLLDPGLRHSEKRILPGEAEPRTIPYYAIAGAKVWGATAMILSELAAVYRRALG